MKKTEMLLGRMEEVLSEIFLETVQEDKSVRLEAKMIWDTNAAIPQTTEKKKRPRRSARQSASQRNTAKDARADSKDKA